MKKVGKRPSNTTRTFQILLTTSMTLFLIILLFVKKYKIRPLKPGSIQENMLDPHEYGYWQADGTMWLDKNYIVNKSRPLTTSNVDIDAIFNFDNFPKKSIDECDGCNEKYMRALLCSSQTYTCYNNSFEIRDLETGTALALYDKKVLAKSKPANKWLNYLTQWVFIPINKGFCDCIVYIAAYEPGLNNVVMNHLTAREPETISCEPFIGIKEQYWVLDSLDKNEKDGFTFNIRSWYWDRYLVSDSSGEIYMSKEPKKWYIKNI